MFKPRQLALLTLSTLLATTAHAEPIATPLFLSINNQVFRSDQLELKAQGKDQYKVTTSLEEAGSYQIQIADKAKSCGTTFGPADGTALPFGKPNPVNNCAKSQQFELKVLLPGNYDFTLDNSNPDAATLKVLRATKAGSFKRQPPAVDCLSWDGGPVTVKVGKTWPNGTTLRDAYSGQTAKVKGGKITMTPAPDSEGILLLEPVKNQVTPAFSWDNATVYFMLTDRFKNETKQRQLLRPQERWQGRNRYLARWRLQGHHREAGLHQVSRHQRHLDHAYGRAGAWVHRWWRDRFLPFHGYHGYWALDFTKIDPNYGDEAALQLMVDEGTQTRHPRIARCRHEPCRLCHPGGSAGSGAGESGCRYRQAALLLDGLETSRYVWQLAWL